ncbi:MAG: CapA family protein [Christensenella sp.]|nr:CapA family protein [Christensenella sp.]
MKRIFLSLLAPLGLFLVLFGCAAPQSAPEPTAAGAQPPAATAAPTIAPTAEPTATPEPTPTLITIGAIGDIMIMPAQISGAYNKATDTYDFSRSFQGVANQFRSVDLMCGNFETTVSGKDAGYSEKKAKKEPADTFNAPDSILDNLKDIGFDFLSTANNHALDRKMPGLLRTLDMLDEKGFYHTGTARSNEERDKPLIIDVKGVKIGIVAATEIINKHDKYMNDEETQYAVTRLYSQQERLLAEVKACKTAGADFVIAYPHWDKEHKTGANTRTREMAKLLLEAGADLILGSHPHVVQSIETMTVERGGGSYTGLVVYSMGNFISNMSAKTDIDPLKYGLYVQLSIEKAADGTTTLKSASYMPLLCFYRTVDNQYVHQVVPALSDTALIHSFSELNDTNKKQATLCRDFVTDVCTTDAIPVMEDSDWVN